MKTWLDNNKIYFETVASLLLSIMAVIVGWAQYIGMKQQTTLLEAQTQYARVALLPNFVIASHQSKDPPESPVFNEDKITIDNDGAPVSEFSAVHAVFLIAKITDMNTHTATAITFAVNGYYSAQALTAAGSGRLSDIVGYNNNKTMHDLERACATESKKDNWYVELSIERYVKLAYKDRLDATHTEYFFVPPIYGASRVGADTGEQMFTLHRSLYPSERFIDFDRTSADDLMQRMRTLMSRQQKAGPYGSPVAGSPSGQP